MKNEVVPAYSISAMRMRAAAEWRTGIETRLRTAAMMTASLRVQSPSWQSGKRSPCAVTAANESRSMPLPAQLCHYVAQPDERRPLQRDRRQSTPGPSPHME